MSKSTKKRYRCYLCSGDKSLTDSASEVSFHLKEYHRISGYDGVIDTRLSYVLVGEVTTEESTTTGVREE